MQSSAQRPATSNLYALIIPFHVKQSCRNDISMYSTNEITVLANQADVTLCPI